MHNNNHLHSAKQKPIKSHINRKQLTRTTRSRIITLDWDEHNRGIWDKRLLIASPSTLYRTQSKSVSRASAASGYLSIVIDRLLRMHTMLFDPAMVRVSEFVYPAMSNGPYLCSILTQMMMVHPRTVCSIWLCRYCVDRVLYRIVFFFCKSRHINQYKNLSEENEQKIKDECFIQEK